MTDQSSDDKTSEKDAYLNPTGQSNAEPALYRDPDYLSLMENYQRAQFDVCKQLLSALTERYPDHPRLSEFKNDLDLQLSLRSMEHKYIEAEKKQKTRKTLKLSGFAIFSIVIVLLIFAGSYFVLSQLLSERTSQTSSTKIALLEQQANDLLKSGQPAVAAGLVEQIRLIDEEYPGLTELEERTNQLLKQEVNYQNAVNLLAEGKYSEALEILNRIETENPGLWDVRRLISKAETGIKIKEFMAAGNAAYQKENWAEAITAYESALNLDPDFDDALMKEQLLNSYLRRIINMMESSSTSIEDIQLAEQYYRKAVAMIPQSKAFASERGNLEEVSSNLLELKFTQTANALLQERNQTFASISSAVSYLNKAVNLNPKNNQLQQALKFAQLYQVAFQNVLELNWSQAIKNLSQIVIVNPGYANGNASQLLYEAYYALGKQYLSVGLYEDARTNLEQAEILAFDKSENILQLFQVQVALGDTIARMGDYENAASYYLYAFNKADAVNKAPSTSDLNKHVTTGNAQTAEGNFEAAVAAYQKAVKVIEQVYTMQTVEAPDGATLPFLAAEFHSTTEAIIAANNLQQSMTITFGRELQVPTIN